MVPRAVDYLTQADVKSSHVKSDEVLVHSIDGGLPEQSVAATNKGCPSSKPCSF